jgi:mono/diheme cytochrome c family protein
MKPVPQWVCMLVWGVSAASALTLGVAANARGIDETELRKPITKREGAQIYEVICQACHMAKGQGAEGAARYPALAGDPVLTQTDYILHNVIHGRRAMPAFGGALDDEQVAAVLNYVRTHFGNHADDIISATQAHAVRTNQN